MRVPRTILALLVLGVCICLIVILLPFRSSYLRFMHKSQQYYSELAHGCDAVLAAHPLGTNEFIRIPGTDTSLPKIVRDLRPSRVTISSNRVHLMIGQGRGGFGVAWEEDEMRKSGVELCTCWANLMKRVTIIPVNGALTEV